MLPSSRPEPRRRARAPAQAAPARPTAQPTDPTGTRCGSGSRAAAAPPRCPPWRRRPAVGSRDSVSSPAAVHVDGCDVEDYCLFLVGGVPHIGARRGERHLVARPPGVHLLPASHPSRALGDGYCTETIVLRSISSYSRMGCVLTSISLSRRHRLIKHLLTVLHGRTASRCTADRRRRLRHLGGRRLRSPPPPPRRCDAASLPRSERASRRRRLFFICATPSASRVPSFSKRTIGRAFKRDRRAECTPWWSPTSRTTRRTPRLRHRVPRRGRPCTRAG